MGGGGSHDRHTPGVQGLHDSCCYVAATAVYSPFLVQTEGEVQERQGALPLARVHFANGADHERLVPAAQSHCGGDTSTASDSRRCGNKPRTWR